MFFKRHVSKRVFFYYASTNIGLVLYTDNLEKRADKMRSAGLEFKGSDGSENC
jgi:predicted ferric reductase